MAPGEKDPSAFGIVSLTFDGDEIAILTLDDPHKGANVLSSSVLAEIERHLNALEKRSELAGLIIRSGKPGSFIAGADLREFAASLDAPREQIVAMCHRGRRLFERLSQDAVRHGRGDRRDLRRRRGGTGHLVRSADHDRRRQRRNIGFPEVKLGLFPGWGGTARTPRIVGLGNAVEMVTSGESIDAQPPCRWAWPPTPCRPATAAGRGARAPGVAPGRSKSGDYLRDREALEPADRQIDETELTFLGVTASGYIQGQTHGHYPAPLAALETMLGAAGSDLASRRRGTRPRAWPACSARRSIGP